MRILLELGYLLKQVAPCISYNNIILPFLSPSPLLQLQDTFYPFMTNLGQGYTLYEAIVYSLSDNLCARLPPVRSYSTLIRLPLGLATSCMKLQYTHYQTTPGPGYLLYEATVLMLITRLTLGEDTPCMKL